PVRDVVAPELSAHNGDFQLRDLTNGFLSRLNWSKAVASAAGRAPVASLQQPLVIHSPNWPRRLTTHSRGGTGHTCMNSHWATGLVSGLWIPVRRRRFHG